MKMPRFLMMWTIVLALLASCTIQAPTPAATSLPLSARDLTTVVMQKEELPAEFENYFADKYEGVFPNVENVHEGVLNSAVVIAKSGDGRKVYSNGIAVYKDSDQAAKAYKSIVDNAGGVAFDAPSLGDERYAMEDVVESDLILNKIYLTMIVWRAGDSIFYLSAADSDNPVNRQPILDLIEKIQKRATQ